MLSAKNSLKSMHFPCLTRSTTLPGIGGSDGEIINGSVFPAPTTPIAPINGSASSAERSGRIEPALTVVREVDAPPAMLDEKEVSSGMVAIDDAGGRPGVLDADDPGATAELLPAPERKDKTGHYQRQHPITALGHHCAHTSGPVTVDRLLYSPYSMLPPAPTH